MEEMDAIAEGLRGRGLFVNSERLAAFDEATESNLEGLGPDKCFALLLNSDLRKVIATRCARQQPVLLRDADTRGTWQFGEGGLPEGLASWTAPCSRSVLFRALGTRATCNNDGVSHRLTCSFATGAGPRHTASDEDCKYY